MTPTTPSIGHIFALQSKLDDIFAEGLTNRYARHARTNALVHDWVRDAWIRVFRCRRVSRCHAHLREKQSRHRCREIGARSARKASSRDRWRLRQAQGPNLSPFKYGRRNRRNGFAFAALPRRLSLSEPRQILRSGAGGSGDRSGPFRFIESAENHPDAEENQSRAEERPN